MYDELIDDHPSVSVIYGNSNEISITVFSSLRPASTRTRRRNINWLHLAGARRGAENRPADRTNRPLNYPILRA